ncbi:Zn-dependent metalloprotease [Actinoplanes tereljensis]|uniref:Bacillolysin n=1 Tax=Paractinoplanes tereljensis TaxID=571912 RepID=A0A919TTL3_9ACTN|nr:M36 family metallopeptidase [Actinoplanes tereljensis]GIF20495.1 bacillolysin [Actinoplanes tereljensis]
MLAPLVTLGLVAVGGTAAQAAPPAADGLTAVQTRQSLLGTHTWYQQTYGGIPVFGGYYATHTDTAGQKTADDGRKAVTGLDGTAADLTAQSAKSTVAGRLGGQPDSAHLVIVPGSPAKLAWLTLTPTRKGTYRTLVDADSGSVLQEKNTAQNNDGQNHDGQGRVFDPNPVVKLQNESLTDNDNADGPQFARAYRTVRLTKLDRKNDKLQGAYAYNVSEGQVTSRNRNFVFNRSQDGFEQVMAYYSITSTQEYIHRLGFRDVNNEPQDFSTTGYEDDNSYYDGSVDGITFGTGGVDDAEDNEVIWHEYGHAIQDDQVPGFGESEEAGSIGEGFGDYWAVTMSQATSRNTAVTPWACVMDWDATSYTDDTPHCLRRTDTPKVYPADLEGEVHADGEIWSHALWDVNRALGRTTANRVILESQFFFNPTISMPEAAKRTVDTARQLYGPRAAAKTRAAFHERGLL